MALHKLELDALAQPGQQRRPVSGKDRLHKELVLVDPPPRTGLSVAPREVPGEVDARHLTSRGT